MISGIRTLDSTKFYTTKTLWTMVATTLLSVRGADISFPYSIEKDPTYPTRAVQHRSKINCVSRNTQSHFV